MRCSFALFSGLSSVSSVPAGSLANASSVGAKTVNGPLPFSVSTRSAAACSAFASVLNDPAATAVSTMSFASVLTPSVRNGYRPNGCRHRRIANFLHVHSFCLCVFSVYV